MKNRKRLMSLVLSVGFFACPTFIPAQSDRSPVTTATPENKEAPIPTPAQADAAAPEKIKLVTAYGLEPFVEKLNDHGKLGLPPRQVSELWRRGASPKLRGNPAVGREQ
jgi:hypothetical protein